MSFFDSYDISSRGINAQRKRVNVASSNIANANVTETKEGGPYKKQQVVFEEVLLNKQNEINNNQTNNQNLNFNPLNQNNNYLSSVKVRTVEESNQKPMMKYEPNHPNANENGYVHYPNINPVIEMVNLIEAQRSLEANISAFTTKKSIDNKTIDILNS